MMGWRQEEFNMTQRDNSDSANERTLREQSDKFAAKELPTELKPAARRALEEAKRRRAEIDAVSARLPREYGGRKGPEPVRFGDWEKKGIASDF
jgi:hypothetical protein